MHPLFFQAKRVHLCAQTLARGICDEWQLEVTPTQLEVLRAIHERGPWGAGRRRLLKLFGVQGPAMSRMLGRLERDGLVERRRAEWDRRFVIVHLTERGREVVEAALRGPLNVHNEPFFPAVMSQSEPKSVDATELARLMLNARIGLEDPACFVHPWMHVETGRGFTLANPPPPEAIYA